MRHKNFAVFILSHNRSNSLNTLKLLKRLNYSGKIFIIVDDEDNSIEEYKKLCKKEKKNNVKLIIFSKKEAEKRCDFGDNLNKRNVVLFARNTCFKIAKENGIDYFLELDDDYSQIQFKNKECEKLKCYNINDIEKIFDLYLDFLDIDPRIKCIAMSQGGDFIGGINSYYYYKGLSRKVMNSFFCKTDRYWSFFGRINEDTTAYCLNGMRGDLFFSYTKMAIIQKETQQNKGGLTEFYKDTGTYYKSFMTVMFCPSFVKVYIINGGSATRWHHNINWNNAVPKIINERYKK